MHFPAKKLYDVKEKIQDLEDEKNTLVVDTLKKAGWGYTDVLNAQYWMWHKTITVRGIEREIFMMQDQAWSFEIWSSLKELPEDFTAKDAE